MYSTTSIGAAIATETGHDVLEHCKKTQLGQATVTPPNLLRHIVATQHEQHLRHDYEHVEEFAVPGVLHVIPLHDEITHDGIPPCRDAERDLRLDRHVQVGPADVTA